jgi:hypothetical protein
MFLERLRKTWNKFVNMKGAIIWVVKRAAHSAYCFFARPASILKKDAIQSSETLTNIYRLHGVKSHTKILFKVTAART